MAAKTKAPTTSLIKCTPDITRTQAMIAARTASKMPVNHKGEAAGEQIKTVNAIINAEKTCLLGNDLPSVSFGMTGGISNFSYVSTALAVLQRCHAIVLFEGSVKIRQAFKPHFTVNRKHRAV